MLEYTYKLIKQDDGELLVTVKPLMKDIESSINKMMEIDVDELSPENKQIFDLKILGLKTVYELYLNSCQNITDVRELGNGCVHTLDIRWSKNITTDVSLLASIHNLEYIDIFSDQYDYEYEYLDQT